MSSYCLIPDTNNEAHGWCRLRQCPIDNVLFLDLVLKFVPPSDISNNERS